nr:MAG TPA: hypothetical protein [Caudoviricetes sp.]
MDSPEAHTTQRRAVERHLLRRTRFDSEAIGGRRNGQSRGAHHTAQGSRAAPPQTHEVRF